MCACSYLCSSTAQEGASSSIGQLCDVIRADMTRVWADGGTSSLPHIPPRAFERQRRRRTTYFAERIKVDCDAFRCGPFRPLSFRIVRDAP